MLPLVVGKGVEIPPPSENERTRKDALKPDCC